MITEDYVSFETAKLLKEKGFDQYFSCKKSYADGIGVWVDDFDKPEPDFKAGDFIDNNSLPTDGEEVAAPTLQMAMKWLREVHKIHITVYPYGEYSCDNYQFDIYKNREYLLSKDEGYMTNEQACETAIKYCLENLL